MSEEVSTDNINNPTTSDNYIILPPFTIENPIVPSYSLLPQSTSLEINIPTIETPASLPRMVSTPALIQPLTPLPRVDHPIPTTYKYFTRNPCQYRRNNKKNHPGLGRVFFPSPNPI